MSAQDETHAETGPERGATPSRMALSRRHLVMGGALLAVSGLALARRPTPRFKPMTAEQYEALFPRQFGTWNILPTSELIMPPESELANRLYEHILARSYQNDKGQVVMFLAAYSSVQIDDVQVHRPEVCYAVSGFAIEDNEPFTLKISDHLSVPARTVEAVARLRNENILYWTRVDRHFPLSWSQQRLAMLSSNLEGYYPDGILVRASVVNAGDDAIPSLVNFYRDLTRHCSPEALRILYGNNVSAVSVT